MAGTTNIGIALVLSALDKASSVIAAFSSKAQAKMAGLEKASGKIADQTMKAGTQMVAGGLAMAAPIMGAVKAYADLEEAQLSLQSVMMNANGKVSSQFAAIDRLAMALGDKLPGTTSDFYELFETMIRNGATASDILAGTGKAASYVAIAMKMPYQEAGQMVQRLQYQAGVANKDMLEFMNDIQKINKLGVDANELQYAFSSSAGMLKQMKIQGLAATRELEPALAMLVRTMGKGEKAGTAFSAVLAGLADNKAMAKFNEIQKGMGLNMKFTDKDGNFLGVKNMVEQLDRMRALTANQRNVLISAIAGGKGADYQAIATMVNEGLAGYRKMESAKKKQADIDRVVELQLKGLNAQWDAVKGTAINVAAGIGKTLKPELDKFLKWANETLPKIAKWIEQHKGLVVWIMKTSAKLAVFSLAVGYVSFAFSGLFRTANIAFKVLKFGAGIIKDLPTILYALRFAMTNGVIPALMKVGSAFKWLRAVMLANPVILIITAIAVAAFVIIKYWKPISGFFVNMWNNVKGVFKKAFEFIFNLGQPFQNAGKNIVMSIAKGIFSVATLPVRLMMGIVKKIRAFLPFSPAKEGPLRDIHKIKLVETIAMSLKPAALISAWHTTLGAFKGAVQGNPVQAGPGFGGGGGGNHFVFAPVITLHGGATAGDGKVIEEAVRVQFEKWRRDLHYKQYKQGY